MQVQVNGEDISPEEFLEGNGWCTIKYKTQSNRETAQSNTQNGAHSHTGEGANGNRERSRQQQRNIKQQVIRNSKMPLLPRSDFKIVIRPRGGLDVATTGTVRLASAIYRAANVPAQEAAEDTVCSNNRQNIIVVNHSQRLREAPLKAWILADGDGAALWLLTVPAWPVQEKPVLTQSKPKNNPVSSPALDLEPTVAISGDECHSSSEPISQSIEGSSSPDIWQNATLTATQPPFSRRDACDRRTAQTILKLHLGHFGIPGEVWAPNPD
ncbi:hypothetical protein HPB49_016520 [Dermacentor silvarum]|uniref:Uncharacterized protein n=1 Tax=Dermacentor silvarum TaxID=543639 RepID=A0ACB8CLS4_DERSI|nr:hypothetical protein HPB49_016520 [Dermacentor silvarum]